MNIDNGVVLVDLCDGRGEITCCMWDISESGACLMIPPDVVMPQTFRVLFDTGCRVAVVVWRRWSHVGVKFAG